MGQIKYKTLMFNLAALALLLYFTYYISLPLIAEASFGVAVCAVSAFLSVKRNTSGMWIADTYKIIQWLAFVACAFVSVMNMVLGKEPLPQMAVNYSVVLLTIVLQWFTKTYTIKN